LTINTAGATKRVPQGQASPPLQDDAKSLPPEALAGAGGE
jgi:hypothetical protein